MRQAHAADHATTTDQTDRRVEGLLGAHAFEHSVGTIAAGHPQHLVDGGLIALGHDISRTEFAGERRAILVTAHGNNARGTTHLGGNHTAQADCTIAHDHGCVTGLDLGRNRRVITGGHHIGNGQQRSERRVVVVFRRTGHLDHGAVRLRYAQVFGLTGGEVAAVRAHGFKAGLAHRALAATVRERHNHEVAGLDGFDRRANLFDHTDGLVTHLAVCGLSAQPTEEPQIGTAHASAYHANHDVVVLPKRRLRHLLDGHLAGLHEYRSLHHFDHVNHSFVVNICRLPAIVWCRAAGASPAR